MAHIVIIGAGLTGISTAYHLEQQNFSDYLIFEKEATIGGLCGSVQQDGFTFDFTGHLLHASDDYFYGLIRDVVGLDTLNVITRRSYIYSHDTYTEYPYQINLHGLPTSTIAECIEGFVKRHTHIQKPATFMQWVMKNFGPGFAKHFFIPYQRKIFAYDLRKITPSWTGRFVPSTSLPQIIDGVLGHKSGNVGYNARFLYPKKDGIFSWVKKLADQLRNPIATNMTVERIDIRKKLIYFTNGHVEPYKLLVNTMPLDRLIDTLHETSRTNLKQAKHNLRCNSVINFNLGIKRPNVSDKHWIYFPETKYPFYRMGFWHNFSENMAPAGCSSLYGEFSHIGKSRPWIEQTTQTSLADAQKLFDISDAEILTKKVLNISHAYVIYDAWRDKNLNKIHQRLQEHSIHSVGRYGEWKYSSMQEAVLDGKATAQTLLVRPAQKIIEPKIYIPRTQPQKEISNG